MWKPSLVSIVILIFIGVSSVQAEDTKEACGSDKTVCGEGAMCAQNGDAAECVCKLGHTGDPLVKCEESKDECYEHRQCAANEACFQGQCRNVCEGTCGLRAECKVNERRSPICSCPEGHTGDPFIICNKVDSGDACSPSTCGVNAKCQVVDKAPLCTCSPGYRGNPLEECSQICESSSDCPNAFPVCNRGTCQDPCRNACGRNANCQLVGGAPLCTCPEGTTGNPLKRCVGQVNVCNPSPCGAYTSCRVTDGEPVCSCLSGYQGDPMDQCYKFLCNADSDCGVNATCDVTTKTCRCREGYFGDAFKTCAIDEYQFPHTP